MKDALVGYTGFVGTNLFETHTFEGLYNSKNVEEGFGKEPKLLVYSAVPAEMFLANNFPEKDLAIIENAMENIRKIAPQKVVLISSIAVYNMPVEGDEDTVIDEDKLPAYGKNRLLLEKYVREEFNDYLIVRLPALFGSHLKKNFIYDYIHVIPAMLIEKKYTELVGQSELIAECYENQNNGFYKLKSDLDKKILRDCKVFFQSIGFTAINFTDARSVYQFYNLRNLWKDIQTALDIGIKVLNITSEPMSVSELYTALCGKEFSNQLSKDPLHYNLKSKYAKDFGGENGYLYSKEYVTEELRAFVKEEMEGQ